MENEKLDPEFLQINYAVSYGSVTLKSLQNDNVPELDLLVREAIQNSSDAALNEGGNSYTVDFKTGSFAPEELNCFFDENTEKILNKKYMSEKADYMEIRDTGTSGLTGCTRLSELKDDDHGNFFKLIFDTGKRQINEAAGGNWGFGKSVYYRVGIGIVVFYSRIKKDTGFESRLIITLIEDENKTNDEGKDDTVLNSFIDRSAGKAWWGVKDGEDLLPVTDIERIRTILNVFGLPEFKKEETGTSIIIPYLKTDKLLDEIIPQDAEISDDVKKCLLTTFAGNIPSYLKLSIQRWYAPKIHNQELLHLACNNKWLRASVNGDPISRNKMEKFFILVQELYNTALAKVNQKTYTSSMFPQIETLDINIRDGAKSYFKSNKQRNCGNSDRAGCVSVIRISKSELNNSQSGLSPYDYAGKFEAENIVKDEPIMMYTRDPGMIIDYEINGPWVKKLLLTDNSDEYLLGFFVPEVQRAIREDYPVREYSGMLLGEYLRQCESSDHMNWNDPADMQIVQKIQSNTVRKIGDKIKTALTVNVDATASKLSNIVGKDLLPRIDRHKKVPIGPVNPRAKSVDFEFNIISRYIEDGNVKIDFLLKLKNGKSFADIYLMIASEEGRLGADKWEKSIGTEFPLKIVMCSIDTIKSSVSDESHTVNAVCDIENNTFDTDMISLSLLSETEENINTHVHVSTNIKSPEITGSFILHAYDKKYQFNLRIEAGGETNG